jgi:hypothetical protein
MKDDGIKDFGGYVSSDPNPAILRDIRKIAVMVAKIQGIELSAADLTAIEADAKVVFEDMEIEDETNKS